MPRLTFIIPAFNAAKTLPDTLKSLVAQTIQDWSAVVINDGSTDNTEQIARTFASDSRITVVSQENRGLAGARNTGLRHLLPVGGGSAAAFVSFLDADDTIAPGFVGAMLGAIRADVDEYDAVACAYELVAPDNTPLNWVTRPAQHDAMIERLIETNPYACTCVCRLDALRRFAARPSPPARAGDIFDESLRVLEDWDLWLRATAAGLRWAPVVDQPIFKYRVMPGLSRNIERMWTTGVKVISRAQAPAKLKPRALRRWNLRNAARAIANNEPALVVHMLATTGEMLDDDLTVFAAALMPAFQKAEMVGPAAARAQQSKWRRQIELALIGRPWCARLLARFDAITTDWAEVARQFAAQLKPGEIPTVYGMGWNGQSLVTELATALPGALITWIDDTPMAAAPASVSAQRITVAELTSSHAVAVTPNDPAPMLGKLARTQARVVWPQARQKKAA
jgi:glycosyltransferase involved in cell wall biosynthesis